MTSAFIRLVSGRVMEVELFSREDLTWGFREALRSAVPWEVAGVTFNPFAVETIEDKLS